MTTHQTASTNWFQTHRLTWAFILVALFSLLRAVQTWLWSGQFGAMNFVESTPFALFLAFWFVLLSVGLIGGGIVRLAKTSWRALGWTKQGLFKAIGLGILGFVLMYVNVVIWAMVGGETDPPEMAIPSPTQLLLVMFFAFGLAAWVEENLFRGFLQPLLAKRMSLWLAILVQAAVFSAAHVGFHNNLLDFGATFVAGLILGLLRGRQSSLLAPFLAHGLFWMMAAFMAPPA
jgi:membrane protease YdiL (CAAX protease family)